MRLAFSGASGIVWYWYTGVIDLAQPGLPIVPLVGIDTLIRRSIERFDGGKFHVTSWEANYFHAVGKTEPLYALEHPRLPRKVAPFHWREGPTTFVYSDRRPRVLGSDILPASDQPFNLRWHEAAGRIWTTREVYAAPKHPIPIATWPLEASGTSLPFNSTSTYTGFVEDLARNSPTVPCSFDYQSILPWFPWLLLGQVPGNLMWRANGLKLASVEDVPVEPRAAFAAVHPQIMEKTLWSEPTGLWQGYMRARRPAQ